MRDNLGLKVLSLLLGILLWAYVRVTQQVWLPPDVESMSEIYVTAVLKVVDVAPDLMVVSAPKNVLINVRGSSKFIRDMLPGAVSAQVDLTGKPAGVYLLKVTPEAPQELKIVQMDPEQVSIVLDSLTQRSIPVEVEPLGQAASGFTLGAPVLQPAVVSVEGPRTQVREVHSVKARIDVNNLDTDVVERVSVEARDDRDHVMEDVALSPKSVVVSVPVRSDTITETVRIVPTTQGTLPDGFEPVSIQADPPFVTLVVPRSNPHPPLYVGTSPISLKSLKHTETFPTTLVVPAGATLVKDQDVHIIIKVRKRPP